jgi:hypothetical protein
MRVDIGALVLVVGAGSAGCAIRLDADPPSLPDASAPEPLGGCLPFRGAAGQVTGRIDPVVLGDGRVLLIADAAKVAGQMDSFAFSAPSPGAPLSSDDCWRGAVALPVHPAIDLSTLSPGDHAQSLAGVTTPAGSYLFFSALRADGLALAGDGLGVARWDEVAQQFKAPVFLWTADRPSYGSGAIFDGTSVYVFGGRTAGFLAADMFVARVEPEQIEEPAAYAYWQGGGTWTVDADLAAPFAEGGTSPTVAWNPDHRRWLMAYATPLATEITVRSGLGPTGPWSLPVTLGRCALPRDDQGAFCDDIVLQPWVSSDGGGVSPIVLTGGAGSFDPPAGSAADAYASRLLRAAWPDTLP